MEQMGRRTFEFRPPPELVDSDWRLDVPDGFIVKRMDRALASQLRDNLVAAGIPDWFKQHWGGIDTFLEHGFGFVAVGEEGIASNCRAAWVKNGEAPIQVSTRQYARRTGLGTLVCRAFIEHCLASGLTPVYECDEDNFASIALAEKLGTSAKPRTICRSSRGMVVTDPGSATGLGFSEHHLNRPSVTEEPLARPVRSRGREL